MPPILPLQRTPRSPDEGELSSLMLAVQDRVRTHYCPKRLGQGSRSLAGIHAPAVAELSEHFTSDRGILAPGYLNLPRYRGAYLLYYLATGVGTVLAALGDAALNLRGNNGVLRVLDVGAGPLTASLAVAIRTPSDVQLQITAMDGSGAALEEGRALLRAIRPDAEVHLIQGNLRDGRWMRRTQGRFDLIVCANVLNEWSLGGDRRHTPGEFVGQLLADLADESAKALLVEPATRAGSHSLLGVREDLVAAGQWAVVAPCLSQGPCPLAGSMRDWCHAERPWQRPAILREVDDAIGHQRNTLKFSYLALTHGSAPADAPAHVYRVIGGSMRQGMTERRYLCAPQGRIVARWLHGQAPDTLLHAWRGDRLTQLTGRSTTARGPHGEEDVLDVQQRPSSPQGQEPAPRPPAARPQPNTPAGDRSRHPQPPRNSPRPRGPSR